MATVKRGTTPTIRIKLNTEDVSIFKTVEFLFKAQNTENDNVPYVKKVYPGGGVELNNGVFEIYFDEAETRAFAPDSSVYIDVRPITAQGKIPRTPIRTLRVAPTLFGG